MNPIGIFTKTFQRQSLEETLDAVAAHGLTIVQFNLSSVGLPTLPDRLHTSQITRIRTAFQRRGLTMAAVSGTFNIIDPDIERRRSNVRQLRVLANACTSLGTSIITLSTGTQDAADMWRRHPDNDTPEAWDEMLRSMQEIVQIAGEAGVTLAFEPEVSNVVDSARKARRLLDELQSPHLKVVIDAANLFHVGELPAMHRILDEAFDLLGPDIVLAHAKDLSRDGEAGNEAAGTGLLDYDRYLRLLAGLNRDLPLILHGLREDQVEEAVDFLRARMGAPSA